MKRKTKSAATITIHDAPNMTKRGRRSIAAWMRKQAAFLETGGDKLSKRFTARYLYAVLALTLLLSPALSRAAVIDRPAPIGAEAHQSKP